jgi:hypothetical protein
MSLSARHRQALHSIEEGIAESDPGLAGLLREFSRMMAGEEMPTAERGPAGRRRIARLLHRITRRRRVPGPSWLPTMLVLWLLLIGTFVAALAVSHIGLRGPCSTVIPTRCAVYNPGAH